MVVNKSCMKIRKDLCLTAILFRGTFESSNVTRLYHFQLLHLCRPMTQNEGFFDAFVSIQILLLLLNDIHVPIFQDMQVLLHNPVTRAASRTDIKDRMFPLQEALGEVQHVKKEIVRFKQTLTRVVGQGQSIESPIDSDPTHLSLSQ